MEVTGRGCRFSELATKPREVHVDGLVGTAIGLSPDLGVELVAGDHLTGAPGEIGEQVEFLAGTGDGRTVDDDGSGPQIDMDTADGQFSGLAASLSRLSRARTWRLELGAGERLDDVASLPALSNLTISLSSSRAVAMMTGTLETDRIMRSRSEPSRSGRPRSRITMSGGVSTMPCNAAIAVASARTTCPALAIVRTNNVRIWWSSSTNQIEAMIDAATKLSKSTRTLCVVV